LPNEKFYKIFVSKKSEGAAFTMGKVGCGVEDGEAEHTTSLRRPVAFYLRSTNL